MRVRSTRETFKKSGVTGGTGVTEVCMYTHLISIFHTAKIQKKRGKNKKKGKKKQISQGIAGKQGLSKRSKKVVLT